MKVALVHDWLVGMRGGERCLEIACRMFPDAQLYTLLRHEPGLSPTLARMPCQTSFLQRFPGVRHYYRWMLPLMPTAVESLQIQEDVDLVLSFSHAVAHGAIAPTGVPHVCYCFTPMRYAWDLRESYFGGGEMPGRGKLAAGLSHLAAPLRNHLLDRARRWTLKASQRVSYFISISQTISDRIAACYGRASTLIHPPVDTNFYSPAAVPRQDYYLCVSALTPYKRIDLAIETCNRLGRRLVVVGSGPLLARLRKLAGPTVELVGWQSNETICDHYRRCRALLFPGFEDFGIVPLEAQACGAPVIALGHGGSGETVLDAATSTQPTGVHFSEQTIASLSEGIQRFEASSATFLPEAARANAEAYRAELYEELLGDFLDSVVRSRLPRAERQKPQLTRQLVAA